MPKKPDPGRIKRHRVYAVSEAASALGVHRQTVIRWIGDHGLDADRSRKPWLIAGAELKRFLAARRRAGRTRLAPGEMYCLPCRCASLPAERMAEFQMRNARTGVLVGLCPACARLMHRFLRRADLDSVRAVLDVTVRPALVGIVGASSQAATVIRKGARHGHG